MSHGRLIQNTLVGGYFTTYTWLKKSIYLSYIIYILRDKIYTVNHMKRRIIKLGSSFAIALPKDWVIRFGIDKKHEVSIEEAEEGALSILPEERKLPETEERIEVKAGQPMEDLNARIYRAYINGAATIVLAGSLDRRQFDVIGNVQKKFLGLEIAEQSEKRIVFRDFIHLSDFDIDGLLSKIFSGLTFMAEETKKHVSKNEDTGDKIHDMDAIIDRTTNLAFRCCNMALRDSAYMRSTKKNAKEILVISRMLKNLEKIGNLIVGVAYQMNENATGRMKEYGYHVFKRNKNVNEVVIRFLSDWQAYFTKIRGAYFKKDIDGAIEIYSERRTRKTTDMIFGGTEGLRQKDAHVNHEYLAKLESDFEPIVSLSYDVTKDIALL